MIPLHVGSDHPALFAVTLLLAFGPFVVLGAVIVVQRRRDNADEDDATGTPAGADDDTDHRVSG